MALTKRQRQRITRPELEEIAYQRWGETYNSPELRYYFAQAFRKVRTEAQESARQDIEARTENRPGWDWKRAAPPARKGKQ